MYARVSTEHEAQLSALENQKDWYKPLLAQHPEWEVVRMYVDEGITGTSAKKRPQFMRMIEDAEYGDFDLILTREVSRFARNTVDTLQYTRELKSKGVEVFFINDNIKTFDGDGELRLTIMATLAQDESRKTSIRVKAGQQTSMNNGVLYGNGNILGYARQGKEMVIDPEQAKTVRMIYDWYLDGEGIRSIQFKLEQAGRLTSMGKSHWHMGNISKILKNSFYCGIIKYHKQWTPDYLEQKKINNLGDMEFTVVQGTHEPIISVEEYECVQKMLQKRQRENPASGVGKKRTLGQRKPIDVWTEILECECGHKFNRKRWHVVNNRTQYAYQCYSSIRSGTVKTRLNKGLPIDGVCKVSMIPSWKLQMMAKHIFKAFIRNKDEILALAESMLDKHINDKEPKTDNSRLISQKLAERDKLNKRFHNLIEMRADGEISKEIFQTKKAEIEKDLLLIDEELKVLDPDIEDDNEDDNEDNISHEEKITLLRYYLQQSVNPNDDEDIADDVIRAFVVKIIVHEDSFDWYLRFSPDDNDPTKITVDGKRKQGAKISEFCSSRHRQLLAKRGNNKFVKIKEYTLDYGYAKTYLYSFSTRHRVHKWHDLNISVYL